MVVVATEAFKIYLHGVVSEIAEGQEFSGEVADYLVDGGCPVEIVGGEVPEPQQPPAQPPDGGGGDGGGGTVVPDGSAKDVLAWVGSDPDRAKAAADTETAKDKPRSTLLAKLDDISGM